MLVDFLDVKGALDQVLARFEHTNLNEVEPFTIISPSAENVARYIHERMSELLADALQRATARLEEVWVWETQASSAGFRPD